VIAKPTFLVKSSCVYISYVKPQQKVSFIATLLNERGLWFLAKGIKKTNKSNNEKTVLNKSDSFYEGTS